MRRTYIHESFIDCWTSDLTVDVFGRVLCIICTVPAGAAAAPSPSERPASLAVFLILSPHFGETRTQVAVCALTVWSSPAKIDERVPTVRREKPSPLDGSLSYTDAGTFCTLFQCQTGDYPIPGELWIRNVLFIMPRALGDSNSVEISDNENVSRIFTHFRGANKLRPGRKFDPVDLRDN